MTEHNLYPLTDDECDEFRRLPLSFNDMVRAIYQAGQDDILNKVATANEVFALVMKVGYERGKQEQEQK